MFKKKEDDRKPVEQEIVELQRKIRALQNEKKASSEDSQGTMRKQRAIMEKLSVENQKMKAELNDHRSLGGTQAEAKVTSDTAQKLAEQRDALLARQETEAATAVTLQEAIEGLQRRILRMREDLGVKGGINAQSQNRKAVKKQIQVLEGRLDKGLQKFNEAIAVNRALREQIDTLRREKVVFDDIYNKLEQDLQLKKQDMASVIEQANSAYEARDHAQGQIFVLKQKIEREQSEFDRERKKLGQLVESDTKFKEFMRSKVRGIQEQQSQQMQHLHSSTESDDRPRKPVPRSAWDASKPPAAGSTRTEKVRSYDEAFLRIQSATGITDIDELVQTFVHAEDQNFSLFKYSTELSGDIENLEAQIAEHKEAYEAFKGPCSEQEGTENAKILDALKGKWSDMDKKAALYEAKSDASELMLSRVKARVGSIFHLLGCWDSDLPGWCANGISESNLMIFLAVIEARTDEMLKVCDVVPKDDDSVDLGRSLQASASAANLQVSALPSTVEDCASDDDDDDDQRPFTVEELKAKTKANTKKANNKLKGKKG